MESKLYLNMILGDFEPVDIVKRSIETVRPYVDGIYIAVTYKDKQPKKSAPLIKYLDKIGANVYTFKWVWDFAKARQFIMNKTPKGPTSFVYWQDADDILVNGDRMHEIADSMAGTPYAAAFFKYFYSVDLDEHQNIREVLIEQMRECIIRNDDTFKWIGRLHETAIAQRLENINTNFRPECWRVHLTDSKRMDANLDRNIEILEAQVREEQARDPRTIVYLAKGYFDRGRLTDDLVKRKIDFDLATTLFYHFLEGSGELGTKEYTEGSGWPEERAQAYRYVGEIAYMSGNYSICAQAMQSAIDEFPFLPDYYVNLAMVYAVMGEYKKSRHWLTLATSVESPNTTHIQMPRDLKVRALQVDYNICLAEGKLDKAVEDMELICQIMPNDDAYKKNLEEAQKLQMAEKAAHSLLYLGKFLENNRELVKLEHLVRAIPTALEGEQFVAQMKHRFLPPRTHNDNEISILCGPCLEEWSPLTAQVSGIGGSEEAVIYLSEELVKLGWNVTVYANPGKDAGNYDGVEYKPWYDINPNDKFNVFVLWRTIGPVDGGVNAKFKLVWMHDVPNNPEFTKDRVDKVDKIAVLSEFHKSILCMFENGVPVEMPANKVFLTANGIPNIKTLIPSASFSDKENEGTIITPVERSPHAMIYSSSPDRGLIHLLKNWDHIKEEVPDATLDIYYGFKTYDVVHKDNPAKMKEKQMMMKLMEKDGISYHGRVSHDELHRAMAKMAIWAYPTDFTEISCITAMKAQTLGAIPVCTALAALDETVKNGVKIDVDIQTPEGEKEYFEALISLLKDQKKQEEIRSGMMKWAKSYFGWDIVAADWDRLFRVKLSLKGGNDAIPRTES